MIWIKPHDSYAYKVVSTNLLSAACLLLYQIFIRAYCFAWLVNKANSDYETVWLCCGYQSNQTSGEQNITHPHANIESDTQFLCTYNYSSNVQSEIMRFGSK